MKRFTETGKWSDPWYRKLEPKMKLLWGWIVDSCDACGCIEFDPEFASFQVGEKFEISDIEVFGRRVRKLENGRHLIVNFIPFQYGELSVECRPHKVVFDALRKNNLQYPIEYPINALSDRAQDKDKDKDQDGDEGAGRRTTKDNLPTSDRAKRIAVLFGRKLTTEWSDKEIQAFKKIAKQPDEDFELVEKLYQSEYEFLRHDLQTFLNNFTGEVDKARKWKTGKLNGHATTRQTNPASPRVTGTSNQGMSSQYRGVGKIEGASQNNGDQG